MKKTLKILGLLILGAVLGYALLIGVSIFQITRKIKMDPNILAAATMRDTDPQAMSNPELGVWNNMRDKIRHRDYKAVNELIALTGTDIEFSVIPAKEIFSSDESVLAEIRIKNVSDRTLHVNEPISQCLTLVPYFSNGNTKIDYSIILSPMESTWMKTLLPGSKISQPTMIQTTNTGPHKIRYYLGAFKFADKSAKGSIGGTPTMKECSCVFTVEKMSERDHGQVQGR